MEDHAVDHLRGGDADGHERHCGGHARAAGAADLATARRRVKRARNDHANALALLERDRAAAPLVFDWDASLTLLAEGFDMLEEDLDKERFFATVRHAYWSAPDGAGDRALMQTLIGKLDF